MFSVLYACTIMDLNVLDEPLYKYNIYYFIYIYIYSTNECIYLIMFMLDLTLFRAKCALFLRCA